MIMNDSSTTTEQLYPVGMQDFAYIRREHFLYVDKTDLIYQLKRTSKYVFLSRPRRFGKSLLCSTMKYFFEGRRELFEGLAIDRLEQDWTVHPVIHLDLSTIKDVPLQNLPRRLRGLLRPYEAVYGLCEGIDPGECLEELIRNAYNNSRQSVVLIIDEYDTPLLQNLDVQEDFDKARDIMQEFYSPLKAADPYLRFCFITGITKFAQLSIFSTINNLKNITMVEKYATLCGITETELHKNFEPGVVALSRKLQCSVEECYAQLKEQYDGYHFVAESEDIYNPFSLLRALDDGRIESYWFSTGTPSYLAAVLTRFNTDLSELDGVEASILQFDIPTLALDSAIPMLYQSGYLTIKSYNSLMKTYVLGIPNKEVRVGLAEGLLPLMSEVNSKTMNGIQRDFCRALFNDDIEAALTSMRSYFAAIPYPEGGKEFLEKEELAEWHYSRIFYLLFSFMNRNIHTEVKSARGRADVVMYTAHTIYVFEFKVNHSAEAALEQIDKKGYMVPYEADNRKLVKCGVKFSTKTRTLENWKIEWVTTRTYYYNN
jgi:hypothetical protein